MRGSIRAVACLGLARAQRKRISSSAFMASASRCGDGLALIWSIS